MGHTLATMRGAEASTKANRKRDLWKRIRRDIQRAGLTQVQADALAKTLKHDLEELIEIASVEQYTCGHHDGMQKQRSLLAKGGYQPDQEAGKPEPPVRNP